MRLFFRGIYVPQMTKRAWLSLIFQNRKSIQKLLRNGIAKYREHYAAMRATPVNGLNAKVIEDGRSQ